MVLKALGESVSKIILAFVEYSLKCCAFLAAVITLGAKGSLFGKVLSGFTSFPAVLIAGPQASQQLVDMGSIIADYNSQPLGKFTEIHGANALDGIMLTLNQSVLFIENISRNFVDNPFATLSATLIVFFTLFLTGFLLGFIRRSGNVPFRFQLEQRLWGKLFGEGRTEELTKQEIIDEKPEPVAQDSDPVPVKEESLDSTSEATDRPEVESMALIPYPDAPPKTEDDQVKVDVQVEKNVNEFTGKTADIEEEPETETSSEIEKEETVETKILKEKEIDQNSGSQDSNKRVTRELKNVEPDPTAKSTLEKEINQAKKHDAEDASDESMVQKDYSLQEYLQMARS